MGTDKDAEIARVARALNVAHAGTRAWLRSFTLRVRDRVGSSDLVEFFDVMADSLVPEDPIEREFVVRLVANASRIQAQALMERPEALPFPPDAYDALIGMMDDVQAYPARGLSFLYLRKEYMSQVDLKRIWSGMKGSAEEVFRRWAEAARDFPTEPTRLLDDAGPFIPVMRKAMSPSEYRATFLEAESRGMKELWNVLQEIVREDVARVWNIGTVP